MTPRESDLISSVAESRAVVLDERVFYYAVLACENDVDMVFRPEDGFPLFGRYSGLRLGLKEASLSVNGGAKYLVDVQRGVDSTRPKMGVARIRNILDAWDCLEELTESLRIPLKSHGNVANKIYDKLFWGLNLPSVTPAGKSYEPIWSEWELSRMKEILTSGATLVSLAIVEAGVVGGELSNLWKN